MRQSRLRRRAFLATGVAVVAIPAVYFAQRPAAADVMMTPAQVLLGLQKEEIILIDVRRPDEWAATGIAAGAVPLDMRRDDFIAQAEMLARQGKPIALICARGVRSRRVTSWLSEAGITDVIDVPEGMLGSAAGPGWVERGLPLTFN